MTTGEIAATGTIADAIKEILTCDSGEAREYLRERFLTACTIALFEQRKAAGLTQTDVATRMNTKQPAISALEADFGGSFSLRRYVDYLLACGVLPLDLSFAPEEAVRRFLLDCPGQNATVPAFTAWSAARSSSVQR
jgi:hypothetical protein